MKPNALSQAKTICSRCKEQFLLCLKFLLILATLNVSLVCKIKAQTIAHATDDHQLWEIAPEAYKGMATISDAFDAFNKVYDAMKSIEAGTKPDIDQLTDSDWKTLVEVCDEASFDLRRAKYATDFNSAPFTVAPEQFKCENKAWIIPLLDGYKQKIIKSIVLGNRDIARLDKSLDHAEKMDQLVRECIKIYQKAAALPIYGDIFKWDWYLLESSVRRSVSEYKVELKKHRDKYRKEIDAAEKHSSVLNDNILLITECDKPKPEPKPLPEPEKPLYVYYSGKFGNRQFDLKVKKLGTYYMTDGYIRKHGNVGYSEWKLTSFIENKNNVEIYTTLTFSDGSSTRERLKGTFSPDKKRLNLKYISPQYSSPVQLTLQ